MKKKYYVSKIAQNNGDHEVHHESCIWLPALNHRTPLGEHDSCHSAVDLARRYYDQVNGCKFCSKSCHTQ